jgi:hypothetical protein
MSYQDDWAILRGDGSFGDGRVTGKRDRGILNDRDVLSSFESVGQMYVFDSSTAIGSKSPGALSPARGTWSWVFSKGRREYAGRPSFASR